MAASVSHTSRYVRGGGPVAPPLSGKVRDLEVFVHLHGVRDQRVERPGLHQIVGWRRHRAGRQENAGRSFDEALPGTGEAGRKARPSASVTTLRSPLPVEGGVGNALDDVECGVGVGPPQRTRELEHGPIQLGAGAKVHGGVLGAPDDHSGVGALVDLVDLAQRADHQGDVLYAARLLEDVVPAVFLLAFFEQISRRHGP